MTFTKQILDMAMSLKQYLDRAWDVQVTFTFMRFLISTYSI